MQPQPPRARRDNNFDVLRLLAAALVLLSHSFAVVGITEPSAILDPSGGSWGHVGVLIFFSISGYLIAQSWTGDPSPGRYLIKRVFRIIPALAVMTVATAFVLGPLTTNVSMRDYFGSSHTWLYPVVKTLLFVPGNVDPPGIFAGNPWVGANPSLWTLPVEFLCYLLVMALLSVRVLRVATCATVVVAGTLLSQPGLWAGTPLDRYVTNAGINESLIVIAAFFTGTLLFLFREKIRLRLTVALAFLVVLVVFELIHWAGFLTPVLFPYVVLTAALTAPVVPLGRFRGWDLSYATYLYGFPLQQLVVSVTNTREPYAVFGLVFVIIAVVAAASWRWIERPMLALGKRIVRRSRDRRRPAHVAGA